MSDSQEKRKLLIKILDSLLECIPDQERGNLVVQIEKYNNLLINEYSDQENDKYSAFELMFKRKHDDVELLKLFRKIESYIDPVLLKNYFALRQSERVIASIKKSDYSVPVENFETPLLEFYSAQLPEYLADHSKHITPELRDAIREYILKLQESALNLQKELKQTSRIKKKLPSLHVCKKTMEAAREMIEISTNERTLDDDQSKIHIWNYLKSELPFELTADDLTSKGDITRAAEFMAAKTLRISLSQLDEILRPRKARPKKLREK